MSQNLPKFSNMLFLLKTANFTLTIYRKPANQKPRKITVITVIKIKASIDINRILSIKKDLIRKLQERQQ